MSKLKIIFLLATVCCNQACAAFTDPELISLALAAAKSSREGTQGADTLYLHCRERALTFSVAVPSVGRSENNLNEVRVERGNGMDVVNFVHYGAAYDGYNCRVIVQVNRDGRATKVTMALLQ
jgi:hypothetical protein